MARGSGHLMGVSKLPSVCSSDRVGMAAAQPLASACGVVYIQYLRARLNTWCVAGLSADCLKVNL